MVENLRAMSVARFSATEHEPLRDFVSSMVVSGIDASQVPSLVRTAGERISASLRLSEAPLWLDGDSLIASGIAGLIRLAPNVELEVAPKFLGVTWPSWREDFFLIANLARSGIVLPRERISARPGPRDDLVSLIARTLVEMFEHRRRRPIRVYGAHKDHRWALDGDVDPESILLPGSDGFSVESMSLSLENPFNAIISAGAYKLVPDVRDGVVQRQLLRMRHRLGPQGHNRVSRTSRVPARHATWQAVHDLSAEVLRGYGVRLEPGPLAAPGFVMRTWLVWEQLVTTALRLGARPARVADHPEFVIGHHEDGSPVAVTPDALLHHPNGKRVLVDAKYKGRTDKGQRISAGDLYEALAFLEASSLDAIDLVYPLVGSQSPPLPVGTSVILDTVRVRGKVVRALGVECRGISWRGGLDRFCSALAVTVGGGVGGNSAAVN